MASVPTVVRELAAAHPESKLPCPVCANTVKASNLGSHVEKVHADAPTPPPWRGRRWGIFPARLEHADRSIVLHTLLRRRTVTLPCAVHVGSLIGQQAEAGMASYGDDMNIPMTEVTVGWYLRLGNAITIGCKRAANLKAHWVGWEPGPTRKLADLVVDRRVLVEIEYLLAGAGILRPGVP